jgi:uncharacterized protein involved in response to NO
MTFSTEAPEQKLIVSSNAPDQILLTTPWRDRFISQSHQLFFSSSLFFAIVSIGLTLLVFLRVVIFNFEIIHGFGLMFGVFTNAFIGFLITVIPRYTTSYEIEPKIYVPIWALYQIAILIGLFIDPVVGKIGIVVVTFYICKVFYLNIMDGYFTSKKESFILTGILVFGAVLLLVETIIGKTISYLIFWSYLIPLVFVVAQKMIPAFYSSNTGESPWQKPKYFLEASLVIFVALGISIEFEFVIAQKIVSLFALSFFSYFIFNLNVYKKTPPIVAILVVAFVWFWIGILVLFVESIFEIQGLRLSLHIMALGFVLNLLIGFGSRVILGHSVPPQRITADKLTIALFGLVQFIVITRIVSSLLFMGNSLLFNVLLYLSSILWICLFIIWGLRYGKTLLRL